MIFVHFTRDEFDCHCGCGANLMADDFIQKLDDLRTWIDQPIIITSGYRCPKHNDNVASTGLTGPHTTGRAADVLVMGHRAHALVQGASASGLFTGIGVNQRGTHSKRFIHLDDLQSPEHPRPNIWTY